MWVKGFKLKVSLVFICLWWAVTGDGNEMRDVWNMKCKWCAEISDAITTTANCPPRYLGNIALCYREVIELLSRLRKILVWKLEDISGKKKFPQCSWCSPANVNLNNTFNYCADTAGDTTWPQGLNIYMQYIQINIFLNNRDSF